MSKKFYEEEYISGYGGFAYVYDSLMNDVDYKKRASYLAALFSDYYSKTKSVLDLACGTGSLSLQLAKLGYEVIGVDSSPDMLSIANDKNTDFESSELDFIKPFYLCQDMRELDLYGTVEAAVSTLDSFNHITKEADIDKFLSRLNLFIEPNGLFIFDINTVFKHQNVLGNNNFIFERDGIFVAWENKLDEKSNIVEIYLDIFQEDESGRYLRTSEYIIERAYEVSEIEALLKKSGFELVNIFDDLTKNPPKPESERLTVVARRI